MKIKMTMDWSTFEKGKEYEVTDREGCKMVGTGVCAVLEHTNPSNQPKGRMVKPEKESGK